jgi:uncharacterized protein
MLRSLFVSAFAVALGCAPAGATLVDRYSFTTAGTDSVGGKNATLQGGATVSGGALQLSGASEYASIPGLNINSFSGLTIEVWFTLGANPQWSRIFDFGSSQSSYLYLTPNGSSGTPDLELLTPGGSSRDVTDPSALTTGDETFMAITIKSTGSDDSAVAMYVNGTEVASGDIANQLSDLAPTTNNWLGQSEFAANPYFNGSIDEFRVFNDAQTAGQIAFDDANGPDVANSPEPGAAFLLLGGLCLGAVPYARRRKSR